MTEEGTGVQRLAPRLGPSVQARAMKFLIADPILRARLVAGAGEAFAARFTEEAVVAQYLDFYEDILKP